MDNPSHPTQATKTRNPLKYTFDGYFSPDIPQDDSSSESGSESRCLNSSFQVIANSMLRMEAAQFEMMKRREMARLASQRRQAELEDEMTRMMLQTQVHIASTVCHTRKRKNNVDHHSTTTSSPLNMHRLNPFNLTDGSMEEEALNQLLSSLVECSDGALLLTLLLSNMI